MKTKEEAKVIIEGLGAKQTSQGSCELRCPRCGRYSMRERTLYNCLSRYATVYICEICGMNEALRDAYQEPPLPLNQWHIITGNQPEGV